MSFYSTRWRRLWRVQIQDWLIAAIQHVKILLKHRLPPVASAGAALILTAPTGFTDRLRRYVLRLRHLLTIAPA